MSHHEKSPQGDGRRNSKYQKGLREEGGTSGLTTHSRTMAEKHSLSHVEDAGHIVNRQLIAPTRQRERGKELAETETPSAEQGPDAEQ